MAARLEHVNAQLQEECELMHQVIVVRCVIGETDERIRGLVVYQSEQIEYFCAYQIDYFEYKFS